MLKDVLPILLMLPIPSLTDITIEYFGSYGKPYTGWGEYSWDSHVYSYLFDYSYMYQPLLPT